MKKLLLLIFILSNTLIFAQVKIKGVVVDGLTNETLIGANVLIKGTNNGSATNFNGEYIINYKCAKKLLQYLPMNAPIDSWLSNLSSKINIYRHNYTYIGKT